jgi:hypothetical protein
MMRAFRKAFLPSLFKMLTFYIYKTFFPWWVSEGNIKYLKNQTRSLCSIKPLHAKYGRRCGENLLHFLIQYSSQLTQVNLGSGWISTYSSGTRSIILKENQKWMDDLSFNVCRCWFFFTLNEPRSFVKFVNMINRVWRLKERLGKCGGVPTNNRSKLMGGKWLVNSLDTHEEKGEWGEAHK